MNQGRFLNSFIVIIVSSLILFTSSNSVSQVPAQSDKKAESILKGVSDKYRSYKSLKATFIISVENPDNKSSMEDQKGTIYVKGNKYRLEISSQDIISDGTTRWTFVKDANEVQIDHQRNDDNSISPANIFTLYEKGFYYRFAGEQTEKGLVLQSLELIPVDPKKKNYFKVKLSVDKNDKNIRMAKLYDKNGSIQTIRIDKIAPNAASDDGIFSFSTSKYPGAEIIDLR